MYNILQVIVPKATNASVTKNVLCKATNSIRAPNDMFGHTAI